MTVAVDMIDLQFWQGPADGWHFEFQSDAVPSKIQFICDCTALQGLRFSIYVLSLKRKRYEYVGSSRRLQKNIQVRETMITRPFYVDKKNYMILQEWVPVSSLKEGN
jgi:hypothetical protein